MPACGTRLVARAWVDDGFRERLLADSKSASAELDIDLGPIPILVMENTPETRNVVVCTLCSCYPRFLLGLPPDWYKFRSYRSRAVREPRRLLAEFGTDINARLRDELLNGEIFHTLKEAQVLIESWRCHRNAIRPHGSLGYRPPAPETIVMPSWPPGSAALRRPPSLAEKPAMH